MRGKERLGYRGFGQSEVSKRKRQLPNHGRDMRGRHVVRSRETVNTFFSRPSLCYHVYALRQIG